jgi:type VI secretion system FHA domain protein
MTFSTPNASAADDIFAMDGQSADDNDDDDPFADLGGGGGGGGGGGAKPAPADALSLDDPETKPAALSLDEPEIVRPPKAYPEAAIPAPTAPAQQPSPPQQARRHPNTVFPVEEPVRSANPPPAGQPDAPKTASTPASSAETDRTLAALFATLGIALEDVPPEQRHEMAAEIGRSFRALADGMRELLASRRDVKIALGLGATQIETGSNPLKFSRDANDAVNALLRPSATGFLTGSTAVSDAVTALQQHQVALVGGVKASMKTALAAFDPDQIEKKLTKRGVSQIIPMKRKAELWEQFVENYKDFASEADEDIRRVIGKQLEQLYADEATRSRAALNL